jgi:hypothetical protein
MGLLLQMPDSFGIGDVLETVPQANRVPSGMWLKFGVARSPVT